MCCRSLGKTCACWLHGKKVRVVVGKPHGANTFGVGTSIAMLVPTWNIQLSFVRLQHELHGLSPVFPASGGSKTSSESRHDQSSPRSFATLRWGRNPLPSWITPRMGIQNRCVNVLLGLNSPTPFPPDVRLLLGCLPARNGYCGYRRPNRLVDFVRATRHTPDHE